MSKLEYNISTEKLTWISNGKTIGIWHARSGGNDGFKHLPRGVYTVGNPHSDKILHGLKAGFNVPGTNNGYFIPLYRSGIGRKGFGIHPDGGKPKTHGCVGISKNAIQFFHKFISSNPRPTRLYVK